MRLLSEIGGRIKKEVDKGNHLFGAMAFEDELVKTRMNYGNRAIDHYSESIFNLWNVKPDFSGAENMDRLLTEPGLVIANHPGIFDIPIALEMVKNRAGQVRKDFKILVNDSTYPAFAGNLGKENFIELKPKEYKPAKQALDSAIEHIKSGGLFLMFPSGGIEQSGNKMQFYGGLPYVLEHMEGSKMVYSFSVNPTDFVLATKGKRKFVPSRGLAGAISSVAPVPNLNRLRTTNPVRILGRYSTASDWQADFENEQNVIGQSDLLAQKFINIHRNNL